MWEMRWRQIVKWIATGRPEFNLLLTSLWMQFSCFRSQTFEGFITLLFIMSKLAVWLIFKVFPYMKCVIMNPNEIFLIKFGVLVHDPHTVSSKFINESYICNVHTDTQISRSSEYTPLSNSFFSSLQTIPIQHIKGQHGRSTETTIIRFKTAI